MEPLRIKLGSKFQVTKQAVCLLHLMALALPKWKRSNYYHNSNHFPWCLNLDDSSSILMSSSMRFDFLQQPNEIWCFHFPMQSQCSTTQSPHLLSLNFFLSWSNSTHKLIPMHGWKLESAESQEIPWRQYRREFQLIFMEIKVLFLWIHRGYYCAPRQKYGQLPGSRTSWDWSAEKGGTGGGGGGRGRARPTYWGGERSVRIQQRWSKHDEGQRGIYSGCDAAGSAANRVRRLPIHS